MTAVSAPSNPYLARTLSELDQILESATPAQLDAHPRAGKWSAAEILEHLDKTYIGTGRLFEKILESGELRVRPLSIKQWVAQLVVIGFGYMPHGRKAPEMTLPAGMPAGEVIAEVRNDFMRMAGLHSELAQRYGKRRIGQHLIFGALNADGWARFHWIHGRHHFRQIHALLDFHD